MVAVIMEPKLLLASLLMLPECAVAQELTYLVVQPGLPLVRGNCSLSNQFQLGNAQIGAADMQTCLNICKQIPNFTSLHYIYSTTAPDWHTKTVNIVTQTESDASTVTVRVAHGSLLSNATNASAVPLDHCSDGPGVPPPTQVHVCCFLWVYRHSSTSVLSPPPHTHANTHLQSSRTFAVDVPQPEDLCCRCSTCAASHRRHLIGSSLRCNPCCVALCTPGGS
eukprot:SAG11_NODE_5535_length_1532_cov_1.550593_1_plen_223_part_00